MKLHIEIIGFLFLALAFMHAFLPRYFDWKNQLKPLNTMNRQMMIYHMFFIALMVFLMGLMCINFSEQLINSDFGKIISLGLAIFWSLRALVQFFGYSSSLWKGKRFETIVHIVFSIFWIYISVVFWICYLS